jgi:hypothetical protein
MLGSFAETVSASINPLYYQKPNSNPDYPKELLTSSTRTYLILIFFVHNGLHYFIIILIPCLTAQIHRSLAEYQHIRG